MVTKGVDGGGGGLNGKKRSGWRRERGLNGKKGSGWTEGGGLNDKKGSGWTWEGGGEEDLHEPV